MDAQLRVCPTEIPKVVEFRMQLTGANTVDLEARVPGGRWVRHLWITNIALFLPTVAEENRLPGLSYDNDGRLRLEYDLAELIRRGREAVETEVTAP